ncbi:hypothetical protein PM082_006776 [Marasmius tenuissimus]|nr:hypothetical protein PM082_006776 [Marasmius tenuissimus]
MFIDVIHVARCHNWHEIQYSARQFNPTKPPITIGNPSTLELHWGDRGENCGFGHDENAACQSDIIGKTGDDSN